VFNELGALAVVCDRDVETAEQMAAAHGVPGVCDFDAVLADPAIDAVAIATPAVTHEEIARKALAAGRDVFVEKPLAMTPAGATDLGQRAARAGRILMVGHILHFHPAFRKMQALVDEGELGRLHYVYSHRLNFGRIRHEENILWSFAPHDIAMILTLARGLPESVECTGQSYLNVKVPDITTTHLEFANNVRAQIFVSWLHPFKEQKLVVVGDRRMAVFDDTMGWDEKLVLYDHSVAWRYGTPVAQKGAAEPVELEPAEPLLAECKHFLDCCANRTPPLTDAAEGERVLAVLDAAQRSMEQRRAVSVQGGAAGGRPGVFVHDSAVVDAGVEIGPGSKVWHFSHLLGDSRIGPDCVIGQNVMIGPAVRIGRGCKIQNNVSVYQGVTLEDEVFCGPSVVFTNVSHPRAFVDRKAEFKPTLVRHGATLGANCTIVCGVEIGAFATIGAGAVVVDDVPDHALMVGNPARRIGWVSREGERLGPDLVCPRTGEHYMESPTGLVPLAPELAPALAAGAAE
jgi:UDP-2-acetamido-3-amino-2,3-dideoxy-glucuronate N-acetyltransferase